MNEFIKSDIFKYLVKPVIYIFIAYLIYQIINLILNKVTNNKKISKKNQKRVNTTISIIINLIKYTIILLTILVIIGSFGVDVSKFFAGLGIAAAVLTLAFQDLAKDFIAGISIVMENQFEIGDNVSINGFRGEVISMGLKTTKIKDYKGAVKIIANHTITEVINYSLNPSLAEIDIAVSYENDLNKVEKVIEETINKITTEYKNLKGKVELIGVQSIENYSVIYRISVKTKSLSNFEVERSMKRDFQMAFIKAGIKLPKEQLEVKNGK